MIIWLIGILFTMAFSDIIDNKGAGKLWFIKTLLLIFVWPVVLALDIREMMKNKKEK